MPRKSLLVELEDMIQRVTWIDEPWQLRRYLEPMECGEAGFIGSGGTNMCLLDQYLDLCHIDAPY